MAIKQTGYSISNLPVSGMHDFQQGAQFPKHMHQQSEAPRIQLTLQVVGLFNGHFGSTSQSHQK